MQTTMQIDDSSRRIPGEVGIWGFMLCDLTVFSIYFITFLYERAQQPEVFLAGSAQLGLTMGVINTLALLTSSLFVALAVQSIRHGKAKLGQRYIIAASLGGLMFIVNKPIEWSAKMADGFVPQTDTYFQLYYMMTGLHLLHVIVGMGVLFFLWRMAGSVGNTITDRHVRYLENGAIYWHLVDLIWLVLFALYYLIK